MCILLRTFKHTAAYWLENQFVNPVTNSKILDALCDTYHALIVPETLNIWICLYLCNHTLSDKMNSSYLTSIILILILILIILIIDISFQEMQIRHQTLEQKRFQV